MELVASFDFPPPASNFLSLVLEQLDLEDLSGSAARARAV